MKYLLLSILVFSFQVSAEEERSLNTEVSRILSYSNFLNGDVGVELENTNGKKCKGFWMSKDDRNFNVNMSLLIAAYQAKTMLAIYGVVEEPWAATGSAYCRLTVIDYI